MSSKTHGMSDTRLWRIWREMRRRCDYPKHIKYKHYGGRGIKVCDEWNKDFMAFYSWAMANGYDEKLTIDRIDVNGNYEPSNCRWLDYRSQNLNRRSKNKSGIPNVYLISGTYYGTVWNGSKNIYTKGCKTKEEAAEARAKLCKAMASGM